MVLPGEASAQQSPFFTSNNAKHAQRKHFHPMMYIGQRKAKEGQGCQSEIKDDQPEERQGMEGALEEEVEGYWC